VAAPRLARLATVFARWAGGNAWAPLVVVLGLGCHVKLGFSILSLRISKNTFLLSAFFFILCIFTRFSVLICKTYFLEIQVELGQ